MAASESPISEEESKPEPKTAATEHKADIVELPKAKSVSRALERIIANAGLDDPPSTTANPRPLVAVAPKSTSSESQQMADALERMFGQTQTFEARLSDLDKSIADLERLAHTVERAFEPLISLQDKIAELGGALESMKTFQMEIASLAENFEPMRLLYDQVTGLTSVFLENVGKLGAVLDPAALLRERILTLAQSFDSATSLQSNFEALRASAPSIDAETTPKLNGIQKPASN
jgi:hypothetical protein